MTNVPYIMPVPKTTFANTCVAHTRVVVLSLVPTHGTGIGGSLLHGEAPPLGYHVYYATVGKVWGGAQDASHFHGQRPHMRETTMSISHCKWEEGGECVSVCVWGEGVWTMETNESQLPYTD